MAHARRSGHGYATARRTAFAGTMVAGVLLAASGCGSSSSSSASGGAAATGDPINIGASIPLSGPLAGFGSFQKWGYQHAVDKVNAAGGVTIGGVQHKVNLVILDDKTDPNTTSANIDTLISKNNAVALLGSCTPDLVNAGAVVADRKKLPMVTGCDPLEPFTGVKQWSTVWDIFFSVTDLSAAPFQTLQDYSVSTNKKVAILHDNGPDGQAAGKVFWPAMATKFGYTVVDNEEFPTDATSFGSLVSNAKASGADIVLVDAVTPQAVALRKQMASAGFTPKVLVMEKGAEPVQFAQALGGLANGVIVGGYWDPSFPFPGAADLRKQFETETGQTFSQHIADSEAAAEVLLDAITAAGSTAPDAINSAIAKTDKAYVVGPVKFAADHTSKLAIAELQWQSGAVVLVGPKGKAQAPLLFPVPS